MRCVEKVKNAIDKNNSLLCVGLDTDIEKIPPHLKNLENPILAFNKVIIDATKDVASAYKINVAFYEAAGIEGYQALKETVNYIPKDVITIGDAKRGDIGNTTEMYVKALFYELGFDMVTVNPYMGYDSVAPFLRDESKGAFVLCLTSNPGAADFQLPNDLYRSVAMKINEWNKSGNCGAVVGATKPQYVEEIRSLIGDATMLIPGIGAQGGDLQAVLKNALTEDKKGAFINSSRDIIYKSSGTDFADVARERAIALRNEINKFRK